MSSIADMARAMESLPKLDAEGLAVSKHLALMHTVMGAVQSRRECGRTPSPLG
jgi:hypothetical protein